MKTPAHYAPDVLFFFDGKPAELALYETLFRHMEEVFPDASVKVQKSQISFTAGTFSALCPCRCAERKIGRSTVSW